MELFIRIVNGQPFEHPILVDNFRQAFPDIDVNNLPPEFARFIRVSPPVLGVYDICETTYERSGDIFTDVHRVRPMTENEKTAKQLYVKQQWAITGFASWVFNEDLCAFQPPMPRPQDNKPYRWDEPTVSWVEVTDVN